MAQKAPRVNTHQAGIIAKGELRAGKHESGLLPTWQYAPCFTGRIDYKRDSSEVAAQNGSHSKFTMAG